MGLLDIWEDEEETQLKSLKTQLDALMEDRTISKTPFENLVFEGGGVKGMAYVGALQVSQDLIITFPFKAMMKVFYRY